MAEKNSDTKTTIWGSIAGGIVAFGQPIVGLLTATPQEALQSFSARDFILGIALAVLGKFAAGTRK